MSKIRFIVVILSLIYILFIFPLAIIDLITLEIFILIGLVLIISFHSIKRVERKKIVNVSKFYLDECDPIKYIKDLKKLLKHFILFKSIKYLNEITIALAYISAGNLDDAKNILESLVDIEPKFSVIIRFWYYKAWIYYFEETNEIERIKVLIEQSRLLIDKTPTRFKAQMLSNYNQIIARYYVLANIHLNLAEEEFNKIFKTNFPKMNVVVNVYYLGVIAYRNNDLKHARDYFKSVVKNGNKLNVVLKSNEYLEKINLETSEN